MNILRAAIRRSALLACALLAAAGAATAQEASRGPPIRLIVPVAAGGVTDAMGRLFAREMGAALGQLVIVENRGGANGTLGAAAVARAAPDGLTLCFCHSGPIVLAPLEQTAAPYHAERDLLPITRLYDLENMLVARAELATTLAAFIARARARPGELSFGSTGVGGALHLGGEMLRIAAGLELIHVPYPGEAPMVTDLLAGRLDLGILSVLGAKAVLADPRMRALAATGPRRAAEFPAIATVAEQGFPGFHFGTWTGLFAPAATPGATIERLYDAAETALAKPELRERMLSAGVTPVIGLRPAEFARYLREESARWREVSARLAR